MLVAYDHGNNFGKDSEHNLFENGYKQSTIPKGNADEFFYKGKFYNFNNRQAVDMANKCNNDRMMICTLFAIGEQLVKRNADARVVHPIILGVDTPLDRFGTEKENYINYYKDKTETFTFKGKQWTVKFKEVYVYPQGFIAWAANREKFENYETLVMLDIGGQTVDVALIIKTLEGGFKFKNRFSLPTGIIHLFGEINEQLQTINIQLDETQLTAIIRGKDTMHKRQEEIKTIVDACVSNYMQELKDALFEKGVDTDFPFALAGGGADTLASHFEGMNIVENLGIFANADAVMKRLLHDCNA